MRTFNVSFLAVLSCIVMIGATSIGNRSPQSPDTSTLLQDPPRLVRHAAYVAFQQLMQVLT